MPDLMTNVFSDNPFRDMIPEEYQRKEPLTAEEYARRQCEWYNNSIGTLDGLDCPECKNRGYFQILGDDGERHMRECKCMSKRRYVRMMHSSGLGDLYERCTFETYIVTDEFQAINKAAAMRYAAKDGNSWFMFAGASGVGKTHLCTAICSELAKRGRSIKYVQWKRLCAQLIQTKFKLTEQDAIMQEMSESDVLYIDDFLKTAGNVNPSEEALSYALDIIDARYKSDRKTIISSELMIKEIIGFDEALGGRIRERTKGNIIMNERKPGRNYRMRNATGGTE